MSFFPSATTWTSHKLQGHGATAVFPFPFGYTDWFIWIAPERSVAISKMITVPP